MFGKLYKVWGYGKTFEDAIDEQFLQEYLDDKHGHACQPSMVSVPWQIKQGGRDGHNHMLLDNANRQIHVISEKK
jgi:hypothetical protein